MLGLAVGLVLGLGLGLGLGLVLGLVRGLGLVLVPVLVFVLGLVLVLCLGLCLGISSGRRLKHHSLRNSYGCSRRQRAGGSVAWFRSKPEETWGLPKEPKQQNGCRRKGATLPDGTVHE